MFAAAGDGAPAGICRAPYVEEKAGTWSLRLDTWVSAKPAGGIEVLKADEMVIPLQDQLALRKARKSPPMPHDWMDQIYREDPQACSGRAQQ